MKGWAVVFSFSVGLSPTRVSHAAILYFGTPTKKKYIPKLASGEWKGSYGLTEPNAAVMRWVLKRQLNYLPMVILFAQRTEMLDHQWRICGYYTVFAKIDRG